MGSFPRKDPNTSTFWTRIHSMQFHIHIIVQFHVVSKSSLYTVKSVVHKAKIDINPCIKWSLTRELNNEKF